MLDNLYYPLFLKVSGKKCVVVGGGEVAERKAQVLAEDGASLFIVSPHLTPVLEEMVKAGQARTISRNYRPGDLEGALLAIAATDKPEVNAQVSEEARRLGVLVNVVDDPEHSDFILPSFLRRGALTIAVSTGGESPALAKKIREHLERDFPPEYASLVSLVSQLRQELRNQGKATTEVNWQELLDLEGLLKLLKEGKDAEARKKLLSQIEKQVAKS